jgi:hypothetical protein
MKITRYEELIVWQKAMELAKIVYSLQKGLGKGGGVLRMG